MCELPPEALDPYSATDARAGSKEKVEKLAKRHEAKTPLWHPDDNPEQAGPSSHDPER